MRCVFQSCVRNPRSGQVSCCSATSRELWTVGDFYGLPLNGFALRSRLRTLLATPECTGQFSQAGPRLVPSTALAIPWCFLSPGFFSHHSSLTVDLWFDMFVATLWRPGLTFRFPGDPWSNLTSPGQEWFLTRFGASLCQHSLAPKFSILPLEFSQHAPSRSSGSGFMLLGPLFTYLSKIVTWQCGLSSVRVGEASHPGPGSSPNNELLVLPQVNKRPRSASPARPTHPAPLALGRWYCPVSSCPDHCQESSRGWTSFKGLRFHLDLHFMGELSGQVPLDWLHQQGYGVCSVCNRVLSSHFNGLHPRCYCASTAASVQAPPSVGRPLIDGAPGLSDVSTSHGRLRSKCLIHALASVVAHRDERSWVDLLTMPALTLGGPSRGGRHHAPRQAITWWKWQDSWWSS